MRPNGAPREFAPWKDPSLSPLIHFEGVTKRFGDVTAIADLSLAIYEREFFALLGPSGCGKTTLMRVLAGFETPTEGRVVLAGEDLVGVPPYRRPVNMMFQSYALFPHMSVFDNVAFGLRQDKMPKDEIAARVAEMLKLVNLKGLERRKPDQLSGGQRQRVALARALAKRPKVLLLDEPLAALDKKLREQTQFELMELQVKLGMTFMIVTHDQEEAMSVADRIAVMDHGRIVQMGTPTEIYEQPATRYVADFIGDVNLIEAKVTGRDEKGVLLQSDMLTPLRAATEADVAAGAAVAIALRPEKVKITARKPAEATENCVRGVVTGIAYLGDFSIYRVTLENGFVFKAARPNVTRVTDQPITWDDKVFLSWTPEAGVVLTR
ncbi:MAG: ABC transporter ATP-binding protein [Xanthobacteraceae bacterium]